MPSYLVATQADKDRAASQKQFEEKMKLLQQTEDRLAAQEEEKNRQWAVEQAAIDRDFAAAETKRREDAARLDARLDLDATTRARELDQIDRDFEQKRVQIEREQERLENQQKVELQQWEKEHAQIVHEAAVEEQALKQELERLDKQQVLDENARREEAARLARQTDIKQREVEETIAAQQRKEATGQKLIQYQQEMEAVARQANEQRYADVLNLFQQGRDAALGTAQMGANTLQQSKADYAQNAARMDDQQRADIRSQYANAGIEAQQDLVSRGLAGTTVLPTMKAGFTRQGIESENRVAAQYEQQRIEGLSQYDRDIADYQKYMAELGSQWELGRLGVMERKTDEYPDMTAALSLLAG